MTPSVADRAGAFIVVGCSNQAVKGLMEYSH